MGLNRKVNRDKMLDRMKRLERDNMMLRQDIARVSSNMDGLAKTINAVFGLVFPVVDLLYAKNVITEDEVHEGQARFIEYASKSEQYKVEKNDLPAAVADSKEEIEQKEEVIQEEELDEANQD